MVGEIEFLEIVQGDAGVTRLIRYGSDGAPRAETRHEDVGSALDCAEREWQDALEDWIEIPAEADDVVAFLRGGRAT